MPAQYIIRYENFWVWYADYLRLRKANARIRFYQSPEVPWFGYSHRSAIGTQFHVIKPETIRAAREDKDLHKPPFEMGQGVRGTAK